MTNEEMIETFKEYEKLMETHRIYQRVLYEIIKQAGGEIRILMTPFDGEHSSLMHRLETKDGKEYIRMKVQKNIIEQTH